MSSEQDQRELLYLHIYHDIKHKIDNGDIKPGSQIPTEIELISQYNVSRVTVRKALQLLSDENYIIRNRRKGSFVPEKNYQRQLGPTVSSFSEICHQLGHVPGALTIKCCIEDPSEDDIQELNLAPETKIVAVERLRYSDGIPVIFEISHFTEDFDFLLHENLNDRSLYQLLNEKYKISLTESHKTIELMFSNYEWSKYLCIPNNYPLLSIKSTVYTSEGKIIQRSHQLIVGNKFKFII